MAFWLWLWECVRVVCVSVVFHNHMSCCGPVQTVFSILHSFLTFLKGCVCLCVCLWVNLFLLFLDDHSKQLCNIVRVGDVNLISLDGSQSPSVYGRNRHTHTHTHLTKSVWTVKSPAQLAIQEPDWNWIIRKWLRQVMCFTVKTPLDSPDMSAQLWNALCCIRWSWGSCIE